MPLLEPKYAEHTRFEIELEVWNLYRAYISEYVLTYRNVVRAMSFQSSLPAANRAEEVL